MTYFLPPFFFITFSTINSAYVSCVWVEFRFIKCSNNFFIVNITNGICPRYSVFDFLITKTFSNQLGVQPLAKMFLCFDSLTQPATLASGSLSLRSTSKSIYVLIWISISFLLIVLWCMLLFLSTISSNLWTYTFLILQSYFYRSLSSRF